VGALYTYPQLQEGIKPYSGSIPDVVIGILDLHYPSGSGVDSASNRNEYHGNLLEVKTVGA
jgi:hypothetical protein